MPIFVWRHSACSRLWVRGWGNIKITHILLYVRQNVRGNAGAGTGGPGLFGKLLGGEQALLADPSREEALKGCNVPLTVVNVGKLEDGPGGAFEISLVQV